MKKPNLILISESISPTGGSEPGKGWWWSCALSKYFQLHIITNHHSFEKCRNQKYVLDNKWIFYPTDYEITSWKFPWGLLQYRKWLAEALRIAETINRENLAALHHVILGSFRYLPSYEKLKIQYILGPLGGGETTPWSLILHRPVPLNHKITEIFRSLFNYSFALYPRLRKTMKSAMLVLATSNETERVLRAIGARKTCVVFPDALQYSETTSSVDRINRQQSLKSEIRLIWQGRPLWWKGPDLAVSLLIHLRNAGLPVTLALVGQWDNQPMKQQLIKQAKGFTDFLHFVPSVSAPKFPKLLSHYHGLVATSLHDSGGIPLLEAQLQGLPCFSLGMGGNRLAIAPHKGRQTLPCYNINTFLDEGIERVKSWYENPETWMEESIAAENFSKNFGISNIENIISELVVPEFTPAKNDC
jgi:glycosyltransferase involved in cell wall biosynthesis